MNTTALADVPRSSAVCAPGRRRALAAAGNGALFGSWLWLSAPTIRWLTRMFTEADNRTNCVLAACAVPIVIWRARGRLANLRAAVFAEPTLRPLPMALLLLSAVGQVLKPLLLDLNILAGFCFVIGTYAMIGLYLPRSQWKRGLVVALLAVSLLPLSVHLDAFLGFPARIATARAVAAGLHPMGFAVQSTEAILVFENGVANVDLPCSGVKGLWVGGILFLTLTCFEKRRLGVRWLLTGAAYAISLLVMNAARVLVLVLVGVALHKPQVASLVHLPLGVFGFILSSGMAAALVRLLPIQEDGRPGTSPRVVPARAGIFLIAILLSALTLGRGVAAVEPVSYRYAHIRFPPGWLVEPLPLTPTENELFGHHGAQTVNKWRFSYGGWSGSLLVVVADSFRAHHAPEVCLAGSGHIVDGIRTETIAGGLPVKIVDIDHQRASAAYWFQSPSSTTDALVERTLAEVLRGERRWALVSVLFDDRVAEAAQARSLFRGLHAAVGASLVSISTEGT